MRHFPPFLPLPIALLSVLSIPGARAADVAHGQQLFLQNCALCHAGGPDARPTAGQGPALGGIVGRASAARTDFGYSKALQAAHLTWTPEALDRFLSGPPAMVPGTNMVAVVAQAGDRADLIAFLATLKPTPESKYLASLTHARTAGDWQNDAPGQTHRIDLANLPAPFATRSAGNAPLTVDQPAGAQLSVPAGFKISLLLANLSGPRLLRTAPNGDIFIAETREGRIRLLRLGAGTSAPVENIVFANHLNGPFGLAFYPAGPKPQWIYIGNLNSVVRIPYASGDLHATGAPQTVVKRLARTTGGHTTRDVAFSLDGTRLFISVGSGSNVAETMGRKSAEEIADWDRSHLPGSTWGNELQRADILTTDPEGRAPLTVYAAGIRNAVGLAVQPSTGLLWCSTNERDALGDDLVPDYITHVEEKGYYGWPWYYLGNHEDPRHAAERPDLAGTAIVPDVPLQAHSASLQMTFYPEQVTGKAAFPAAYRGEIFAALHGSWNRTGRTGSKVIRVRLKDGQATGDYEDFITGFVVDDGHVWGRPVGVTVANDGALLVTDDANGTLWRVAYTGK